ncbi:hypothetical protein F230042K4_00450 [Mediterraneibacter glycyrrhizinilyticus]
MGEKPPCDFDKCRKINSSATVFSLYTDANIKQSIWRGHCEERKM